LPQEIKEQILNRLTERVPLHKVIVFGSHAAGTAGADSDIDLIVVTDDDYMPATYEENMAYYLNVASALREMRKTIAVDLIVHTRTMHEKFIGLGSMFSREILETGEVLYEKSD